MKLFKTLAVLAIAAFFAAPAFAETQNVKVSGSIDAYAFMRNNYDLRDSNDAGAVPAGVAVPAQNRAGLVDHRSEGDQFFTGITQIEVSADLTDNVSTVINLVNQRDWNADVFDGGAGNAANEFDITLDLAYVQMKEIFYSPLTLTIGRQDLLFGRGFIIGWNPSDPQGTIQADEFTALQAFDAVRATLDFNPWTIDIVYSKIFEGSHDPEDDLDLWIANVNYKFAEYNAVAEGYFVSTLDRNTLNTAAAGTTDNETYTIGGRAQFDPISPITLGAELAYQFGNNRLLTTNYIDRSAWAANIFGTYRWDNTWKPEVTVEWVHLGGEDDLTLSSTEYNAWNAPFRGPTYGRIHEYLETYYATGQAQDQPASQNLEFINLMGSLKPMEDLMLSLSFYYFWTPADIHTDPANATSPVMSDELGYEFDTTVTYSYTEDVTFALMVDWFIPGELYSSPNDATATQVVSSVKVTF